MKLSLPENIRAFRKERKLTQEQLAEAMGVSVGAVSRWESGENTPELSLVVDIAAFFETSVDVLLGFDLKASTLKDSLAEMRLLRNAKHFDEACAMAERMLLRYPNNFQAVFASAVLYSTRGVEHGSKKALRRSQELFERALTLEAQNTDEHINTWTIRNNIAEVMRMLGQTDRAIDELKRNNADGLNDGAIGFVIATEKNEPEEALDYLSNALVASLSDLMRLTIAYSNAYVQLKRFDDALDVQECMRATIAGLKDGKHTSALDMMEVELLTINAVTTSLAGNLGLAEAFLRQAYEEARRFDVEPCANFNGMRFYHSKKQLTAFSSFGTTSLGGMQKIINEQRVEIPALGELWDMILAE